FFFSSRRRHTRSKRDWSSDVCSSDLYLEQIRNCYQHEYQWDLKTQTLTLLFQVMYEKFQELLEKYAIPDFIGKVDPTNYMHLDRSEERRVGKECRSRW